MTEKKDTFRTHLPALAGYVIGTVISAFVASQFLSGVGTSVVLAAGSICSGSVSWYAERGIRRANELAQAKAKARKAKGRPLTDNETHIIEAVHSNREKRFSGGIHYRTIALLSLAGVLAAVITVAGLDRFGTQPAAHVTPPPVPSVTVTNDPNPVQTITGSPSPSVSPSISPSRSPSPEVSPSSLPASSTSSPSPSFSSSFPGSSPSPSPSVTRGGFAPESPAVSASS